jgi:hypothetical protein
MKIENLHQPYIFKNTNDKINIIVSELTDNTLTFQFGEYTSFEDSWKLHLLDENYNKSVINTPKNINHHGNIYEVIAECNGYIEDNTISYVIGGFNEELSHYYHFLVKGNYDFATNTVSNLELLDNFRTGFYKKMDLYSVRENTKLLINSTLLFDFEPYLLGVTRIIPMYGHNKILVTGIITTEQKTFGNITLVYDTDSNSVTKLQTNDTDMIYKSSIYDYENVKLMAYTDKVYTTTNNLRSQLTQTNYDYNLNVDSDFILNEL